jgi:sec-independent protein translocase protein TatA
MRALFESPAGLLLLLLVIVLFGAKKMPDAARSLGRSIRIFKSEMDSPNSEKKDAAPGESPDSSNKDSN